MQWLSNFPLNEQLTEEAERAMFQRIFDDTDIQQALGRQRIGIH